MHITILIVLLVILFTSIYLLIDYCGPRQIFIRKGKISSLKSGFAGELIPQEYDYQGNLWASRGMILYRLGKDDNKFIKMAHIPTGFSFYWFNNFTLFRRIINKPECLEATITGEGHICALSAGYMWHCSGKGKKFHKTMKLRHYGIGKGRGILANGLLSENESKVYFGEYFRNSERQDVLIYESMDSGRTWDVVYKFEPGTIKHIHAIQKDPYTGLLWLCSGDRDSESLIAWSENGFGSINIIGKGNQSWRAAHLVFTKEAVYWGADTGSVDLAGIYRWDKKTQKVSRLKKNDGAVLYGTKLSGELLIFTIDREGFPNEKDNKTRLVILDEGKNKTSEIEIGSWKHKKKNYRYSFAMLRVPRNNPEENKHLAISVINQEEIQAGGLFLIHVDNLIVQD